MAQNLQNHRRFYPLFHFFLIPLVVASLVYATIELVNDHTYVNAMLTIGFFLLLVTALAARTFALKAQDRAIRAEVSLRYFALTGKLLPTELRLGQIVALRFASDEECIALTDRAVKEQLSAGDIKGAIKNWKADYHRV